ncbi:MAG: hypothetical protein N2690_00105 [Rhodocyclaceae bacterium]|nr:hypothetical protein [Rhodocyclaceae bacterium]
MRLDIEQTSAGGYQIVEVAQGPVVVAAAALPVLERRARALALVFALGLEYEQALPFATENILERAGPVLAQRLRVDLRYISWVQQASDGGWDWVIPSYERDQLQQVRWMPLVMPPHEPRSLRAVTALFGPNAGVLVQHLRQRQLLSASSRG